MIATKLVLTSTLEGIVPMGHMTLEECQKSLEEDGGEAAQLKAMENQLHIKVAKEGMRVVSFTGSITFVEV